MALVGGLEAPPGRIMGHAGAWAAPGEPDARTKYQALERAGAVMVNHPENFGEGMKTLFANQYSRPGTKVIVFLQTVDLRYTDVPTANVRD
jgi:succinyl-CoA synthetase alpha subunit